MRADQVAQDLCRVRALRADDGDRARALVNSAVGGTPYAVRLLELLAEALAGADSEVRALVYARRRELTGLGMYGEIAGATGAARLFLLLPVDGGPDGDRTITMLLDAITAHAAASGARFLLAEVPDDAAAPALALPLLRHGFVEAGRVVDYFRDGVALLLMRRGLDRGA